MATLTAQQLQHQLVNVFSEIERTRMQGVPILNPRLQVAAIGFQPWQDAWLGVLITPWFMNLMRVANTQPDPADAVIGSKHTHVFPSGPYEFTLGHEPSLGYYECCSLFSPMADFPDQETTEDTAREVLLALMAEENREQLSLRDAEVRRAWLGDTDTDNVGDNEQTEQPPAGTPVSAKPLSRRQLFTGSNHG